MPSGRPEVSSARDWSGNGRAGFGFGKCCPYRIFELGLEINNGARSIVVQDRALTADFQAKFDSSIFGPDVEDAYSRISHTELSRRRTRSRRGPFRQSTCSIWFGGSRPLLPTRVSSQGAPEGAPLRRGRGHAPRLSDLRHGQPHGRLEPGDVPPDIAALSLFSLL